MGMWVFVVVHNIDLIDAKIMHELCETSPRVPLVFSPKHFFLEPANTALTPEPSYDQNLAPRLKEFKERTFL